MNHEPLATTEKVAEYLSMSRHTLDNWRSQHTGPKYRRLPNGSIRYSWPDVRAWLESQSVEPADRSAS